MEPRFPADAMSPIISSEAFLRDIAHRRGQIIVDRFRWAVRPIYRPHPKRKTLYDHVGTCTLFRAGSVPWLVTAAHILDHHQRDGDLWIGAEKKIVPLQGTFTSTEKPQGQRDLDKFDFAVSRVTDSLLAELGNATFIDSDFVSKGRRRMGSKGLYVCLGYPNSKNKDVHAGHREMGVELFMHAATGHNDRSQLGAAGARYHDSNVFVELGKQVFNALGAKKNPVSVQGMSGGPVFHIGDRGNYNTMRNEANFTPLLEGIIIEKPQDADALVAVSIGTILETLRNHRLL